jgi:hypothetical protein
MKNAELEMFAMDQDLELKRMRIADLQDKNRDARLSAVRRLVGGSSGKREEQSEEDIERAQLVRQAIAARRRELVNRYDVPIQSMIATPVFGTNDAILGGILLQAKSQGGSFTEVDCKLLDWLSVFIALVLEKNDAAENPAADIALRHAIPDPKDRVTFETPPSLVTSEKDRASLLSVSFAQFENNDPFRAFFLCFEVTGLRQSFEIPNDCLFRFCYSIITAYHSPVALARAQRRAAFMTQAISRIGIQEIQPIARFALVLASLAMDLGDDSVASVWTTSFGRLYGPGSQLQKHQLCILMDTLSRPGAAILERTPASEIWALTIELLQNTDIGVYQDAPSDDKKGLITLTMATYLSDIVRMRADAEQTTPLFREFLATDRAKFGLEPDASDEQVATVAFAPVFVALGAIFPCLSILIPLFRSNIRRASNLGQAGVSTQ